jgi:hypothetical protein
VLNVPETEDLDPVTELYKEGVDSNGSRQRSRRWNHT